MAKFNAPVRNYRQEQRSKKSQRKRQRAGDPSTYKLKLAPPPSSLSGKQKKKLLKKWRLEQKKALENGLVSMEDIQMMSVENQDEAVGEKSQATSARPSMQLHMKKRAKLKILKGKGKGKGNAKASISVQVDTMVE
ncbi:hypothetical protein SUGI_0795310 [Cryptomeria japonica]|uniref:uncharacterized protein LOC131064568 n=1 Tax=Cryptomeria japonica TaxID=3369 RepID=UPI002414769F|nr:uncharacterized protein LOC131064568 [Cryptomeria japonica]GLJ39012.1 hypothetical protein SUGI_0795310 [Cryptomeria japonica]